jgi:hypothetical protein
MAIVRFPTVARTFLHHQADSEATRAVYPVDTGNCSIGGKAAKFEADYSPPTHIEVNNTRSFTSTPAHIFMVLLLCGHHPALQS